MGRIEQTLFDEGRACSPPTDLRPSLANRTIPEELTDVSIYDKGPEPSKKHRARCSQEHHVRVLRAPAEHQRLRHHRAALLPKWHQLHGPADGPPRGMGLLPERGEELEREGPDRGHHHHLLLRGPPGRALRDRLDDQSSIARGKWLFGLQGLRGRGAGP